MNNVCMVMFLGLLSGCAASYQVAEVTDRFSDPTKPATVAMKGNAIDYRDPLNAVAVSEMNGFVERDRGTGKVVAVGFNLIFVSKTGRWLSIRNGDEMVFLADGERIASKATGTKIDQNIQNLGVHGLNVDRYDFATYPVTTEQFRKIATAGKLEISVNGANGSHVFPRKDLGFLSSFQSNMAQFYQNEIAPHLR